MNTSEIDSVILSVVGERWKKTAMLIARVADALSHGLPPGDEGYELISRRVEALVNEGRLAAQGDTALQRGALKARIHAANCSEIPVRRGNQEG